MRATGTFGLDALGKWADRRPPRGPSYRRVVVGKLADGRMTDSVPARPPHGPNYPSERWWHIALEPSTAEQRRARLGLLLVAVAIVVVHAALAGLDRPINWDEAVYVTQVNPAVPPVFMEPHRTRGMPLLVSPVAVFDPSMVVLRLYLAVAGAAATYVAFAVWVRLIGGAAAIAAAVYSSFWITVFYSVEVLPNHPSALLAVAITGLFVRGLTKSPVRHQIALTAGLMFLFALVRPPDAAMVGVGLVLLAGLSRRREQLPVLTAAAVGGSAGVILWWIEGWFRFGFLPQETMRSAGEYGVASGRVNMLPLYLQHVESRLRCARGCVEDYVSAGGGWQLPPIRSLLFLILAAVLVVLGTVSTRRRRWVLWTPLVVASPVLGFYAFVGGSMNQRYILLVYALALIPPAIGLRALWLQMGRSPAFSRRALRTAVVVAVVSACWWSTSKTLERFDNPSTRDRAYGIGQVLMEETGRTGADCVLAARVDYPMLQYWSGCLATAGGTAQDGQLQPPLGEIGSYTDLAAHHAEGADLYAVDRESLREGSPLESWQRVHPDAEPVEGYVLYRAVEGSVVPPPPCPPADSEQSRRLAEVFSGSC